MGVPQEGPHGPSLRSATTWNIVKAAAGTGYIHDQEEIGDGGGCLGECDMTWRSVLL